MAEATPLERALILCDDLATLQPDDRIAYYKAVCTAAGLNAETKPLNFLTLEGKLVLYAGREATDQLRKLHAISVLELTKELVEIDHEKLVHVTVKVGHNTRTDVSTGAVAITGLKGEALANAYMKAETKAKRRATLSLCGLGVLDESELDGISPLAKLIPPQEQNVVVPKPTPAPAVNQAPAEVVPPAPLPPPPAPKPAPAPPSAPPPAPKPSAPPTPPPAPVPPTPPPAPVLPPPPASPAPVTAPPAVINNAPQYSGIEPGAGYAAPAQPPAQASPAPVTPPPQTNAPAAVATGDDVPASSTDYQLFVSGRATKLVRDKFPIAGLKEGGNFMKNYLLVQSGKEKLNQISSPTFERLLSALEAATPEDAVKLVKDGSKKHE